jgi:tRNA(adenine34) deaminase
MDVTGESNSDSVDPFEQSVLREIARLRGASDEELLAHDRRSAEKRVEWIRERMKALALPEEDILAVAYELFLERLGISPREAPIVRADGNGIVFHSRNRCPTLEACRALGLDTRRVCRLSNEGSTRDMLRAIDPRLSFTRNYDRLRPRSEFCEELIFLDWT